jgi:hypothetical protein
VADRHDAQRRLRRAGRRLRPGSRPAPARWEEVAYLASNIADEALTIAAEEMTPQQAADYLLSNSSDVQDTAAAYGVIELTPPVLPVPDDH